MAKSKVINLLIAAVLACILWVFVVTVERTDMEWDFYNIPVVLDGEEALEKRGLRVISEKDLTVSLRLFGNRSDMNKLRSSDITVLVDLSRIYEAGQKQLPYDVSFPGNSTFEVVTRNPSSISLTVVEWEEKEIPVKEKLTGTVPQDYLIDRENVTLGQNAVTVSGPKEIVDQISQAQINVNMGGRTDSVAAYFPITLCDGEGKPVNDVSAVTLNVGQVWIEVPVLRIKEVTLRLPIVDGGGLTAEDVTLTINGTEIYKDQEYTITVSGSPADVKKVPDVITLGEVDLGRESQTFLDREYLIGLPEGIDNVTTGRNVVLVSLTLPPIATEEFTMEVKNFEITEPEGYKVTYRTRSVQVVVQGRETFLANVKRENIRGVLDLSEVTESGSYPVEFSVVGVENVGVIPHPDPNIKYVVYVIVEPVDTVGG